MESITSEVSPFGINTTIIEPGAFRTKPPNDRGASRGFGKIVAEAFLERGDKMIVSSRCLNGLQYLLEKYGSVLLPLELDITNRAAGFDAMVKAHFGNIDVMINNAGTGVFGTVEELDEQVARNVINTSLFGCYGSRKLYYLSSSLREGVILYNCQAHLVFIHSQRLGSIVL
jgi:NAD(P)-dependent dehydrogenase (short-subunit alcohol dehydrogenase family)